MSDTDHPDPPKRRYKIDDLYGMAGMAFAAIATGAVLLMLINGGGRDPPQRSPPQPQTEEEGQQPKPGPETLTPEPGGLLPPGDSAE